MSVRVWRKQTVRYLVNGKRASKGTPGAVPRRERSKRYYGTLRTCHGRNKQIPLTLDKTSSQTLLRRLQREEDDKRAMGVTRQDEERQRPLSEHLEEFRAYLETKDVTAQHVRECVTRTRCIIAATKAKYVDDLDAGRVLKTLSDWRKRKRRPISVATSNHYLVSIKSFSRWLWRERRMPDDPLAGLRRMNAEADRRRIRRPLTTDELKTLIEVTRASRKTYRGNDWCLRPMDRAILYTIAAYTGLRVQELRSLRQSSFDLELGTLTLLARDTKNRKAAILPLSPVLLDELRKWLPTLKTEFLFPGSWSRHGYAGRILKRDLKRASVAYVDPEGRYADFHSLRHTFITSLAKAGVHPSKAQRLARHSTIALTMNIYTTLDVDDLRDAVASLPSLSS